MSLKHVLVVSIISVALVGLTACPSTTPIPPPTATPTSLPVSTPTVTPAPLPTSTPILSLDAVLTRGPYLQSVTTNSIIVVWETDQPSQGEVVYGETGEYGSIAADSTMDTRHAVTLTGLEPYTTYHYRVESSGVPLSEELTFRTAAGPDQTQFTFVAVGDTQTQHQVHQAVVDRIVTLEPDFCVAHRRPGGPGERHSLLGDLL